MKVLVLNGSPRKKGNSMLLAEAFCRGAEELGHELLYFDVAQMDIHSCIACDVCRREGSCFRRDAMQEIYPHLVDADAIVLATPLYYFGISSQLKRAIDRFYGVNTAMREHPKKAFLLASCGDPEPETMDALLAHYHALCAYCHWEDQGQVLAVGFYGAGAVAEHPCLEEAYALGKKLL
ncbi:MAG: flavodoxin family protein [Bacillota bacterium]|nr:flavodoxin family protein [Bacillota bacterium]